MPPLPARKRFFNGGKYTNPVLTIRLIYRLNGLNPKQYSFFKKKERCYSHLSSHIPKAIKASARITIVNLAERRQRQIKAAAKAITASFALPPQHLLRRIVFPPFRFLSEHVTGGLTFPPLRYFIREGEFWLQKRRGKAESPERASFPRRFQIINQYSFSFLTASS